MNITQRITDFHDAEIARGTMSSASRMRVHDRVFAHKRHSRILPLSLTAGGLAIAVIAALSWNSFSSNGIQHALTNAVHTLSPAQVLADSLASTFGSSSVEQAFGFKKTDDIHKRTISYKEPLSNELDDQGRTYTIWTQGNRIALKQDIEPTTEVSGALINDDAVCFNRACQSLATYTQDLTKTYTNLFSSNVDSSFVTTVQVTPFVSSFNGDSISAAFTTSSSLGAHGHVQFESTRTNEGNDMVNHATGNNPLDGISVNTPDGNTFVHTSPFSWRNTEEQVFMQLCDDAHCSSIYEYDRATGMTTAVSYDELTKFVEQNAVQESVVGDVENALSPLRYLLSNPEVYANPTIIDYDATTSIEHIRIPIDYSKARYQMQVMRYSDTAIGNMDIWYDTNTATITRFALLNSTDTDATFPVYDVQLTDTVLDSSAANIFDTTYWTSLF